MAWREILLTLLLTTLVGVGVEEFFRQTALRDERLAVTATATGEQRVPVPIDPGQFEQLLVNLAGN